MMDGIESALERLLFRIEELGAITDTPGSLTRTFLSPANLLAARQVMVWMREAGMETEHDAGGTIRGILPGNDPSLPPLLLGSHLDTVIDAGKYDGALGVLIALAALEITGPLDFPIHVLGFSDEEGVRFHATYLGSRACVGLLGEKILAIRDEKGTSIEEALGSGGWHDGASTFSYENSRTKGYVEVHIEQGRMLEELKEPVCGVSAICAQSRWLITLTGHADHAGTTPMNLRRDALTGAAEFILAVERLAAGNPPLVATVGKIEVKPGASNVIPSEVQFTLDVRHPDDSEQNRLESRLLDEFRTIAKRRKLRFEGDLVQANEAEACDEALTATLLDAVERETRQRRLLPSGAGHDAVMMATAMPVAMLFVRCRGGLSHHPEEYANPRDIAVALRVLVDFLKSLR
jgi:allantoate deiminase